MKSAFVDVNNAKRGTAYDDVIADIAEKKLCPFCKEHLSEFHKKPMEERQFWIVTDNMYPYTPSKHHKLFIHREHITHVAELSPDAWSELYQIVQEEIIKNDIEGGTLLMRFGNTKFTGASVSHLHVNLVQSDPDDPSYDASVGLVRRIG